MVQIKCTRKLLQRKGLKPVAGSPASGQVLGDWYATLVPVLGGELLVCLNSEILLTIVLSWADLDQLGTALCKRTIQLLKCLDLPKDFIVAVEQEFAEVQLVKTDSRSKLGLLREVSFYCQHAVKMSSPIMIKNQLELEMYLTQWLHGPAPYRRPVELLDKIVAPWRGLDAP